MISSDQVTIQGIASTGRCSRRGRGGSVDSRGMTSRRPHPGWWVYFQFGGRLPDRYRDWVLHDATCRTWLLRVLVRGLVQATPFLVAFYLALGLLGGAWGIAAAAVLLGVLVGARIVLTSAADSVDARLRRYGFPPGHGSAVRRRGDETAAADAAARYAARWRNSA